MGDLDPRAQEFRPTYHTTTLLPLLQPHIYYSYPCPLPPYPHFTPAPQPSPPLPPRLPPPSATPSRTLLLSSVPTNVSESTVRRELEVFGDMRAVQMERVRDGIVTVHFYDLRNAVEALTNIQEQHMQQQCRLRKHFDNLLTHNSYAPPLPPPARGLISGRAVWAQFTFPVTAGLPNGHNQGTIVIFNLGPEVSGNNLREIFEAFGPVKELRETPLKRHQRFVEFYDIRNAAKALANINGKEIHGKHVVVEFSRPGGNNKRFSNSTSKFNPTTPLHHRPPPLLLARSFSSGDSPGGFRQCFNSPARKPRKSSANGIKTGAVEASIAGLSLSSKKNVKIVNKPPEKGGNGGDGGCSRQWKGTRQMKERYDPRFLIKEDGITEESSCRDSRTTVMIKNIPNKYSQKLLLNMLDNHCIHCNEQIDDGDDQPLSSYDFVYLPIDFINKCNVGYGFVNMTSPEATWRLYKAFHLQNWEVFNSKKICEVSYARLQGVEALKEHFKNSKFPCEAEEYMPVVFSSPRDGRRLTEPTPIFGRNDQSFTNSEHQNLLHLKDHGDDGFLVEQEEEENP